MSKIKRLSKNFLGQTINGLGIIFGIYILTQYVAGVFFEDSSIVVWYDHIITIILLFIAYKMITYGNTIEDNSYILSEEERSNINEVEIVEKRGKIDRFKKKISKPMYILLSISLLFMIPALIPPYNEEIVSVLINVFMVIVGIGYFYNLSKN